MSRISAIRPWQPEASENLFYDLQVACLGYESRARFVASQLQIAAGRQLAIGFGTQRLCAYNKNWKWFSKHGFEIVELPDASFSEFCAQAISGLPQTDGKSLRIHIDISSMSRFRIAALFAAFIESRLGDRFVLDFAYAPSEFIPPPREMSQVESAGPVIPQFAGWSEEPDRPVSTVFGLGFEYDRAIGVVEFLEPSEVWSFHAEKHDTRFDDEVHMANTFFWKFVPESQRFTYRIDLPIDCLGDLESLTFGLLKHSRPILIPFGPKLFALCCLLVAQLHYPRVGVWRVSSGINERPIDRKAQGSIVGLRVELQRGE